MVDSCVSQLHLPFHIPWLYLPQKRRQGDSLAAFFLQLLCLNGRLYRKDLSLNAFFTQYYIAFRWFFKANPWWLKENWKAFQKPWATSSNRRAYLCFWCHSNLLCQRQCNTFCCIRVRHLFKSREGVKLATWLNLKGVIAGKKNIYQEYFLPYFKICLHAFRGQFWYAKIPKSFKVQIDICDLKQPQDSIMLILIFG